MTEAESVMSEPDVVPRNKPNFLLRRPLLVNVDHPPFEHFKGAGQCIPSQVYAVTSYGFKQYLNTYINKAFANNNRENGQQLRQVVAASELTVIAGIQYEDLCDHSGIDFDPPMPDDLFTLKSWKGSFNSRQKVKWAVWNPNQQTWLLQVDTRAAWFTMHILIDMKLSDGEVVRLKLSAARASASRGDLSIRVTWGERPDLGDAFVPENACVLADPDNAAALFKAASWGSYLIRRASNVALSVPSPSQATFASPGGVEAVEETAGEFQRDDELAVTTKVTHKGDIHIMNATVQNFSLLYINSVNNFVVKFRRCVDVHGEGEASLSNGQDIPHGVKYITFYLKIPSNISHHCILRGICCSKNAHGLDINERGISVGDFFCAIKSAPTWPPRSCRNSVCSRRPVPAASSRSRTPPSKPASIRCPARTRKSKSSSIRRCSRRTRCARSRAICSPPTSS